MNKTALWLCAPLLLLGCSKTPDPEALAGAVGSAAALASALVTATIPVPALPSAPPPATTAAEAPKGSPVGPGDVLLGHCDIVGQCAEYMGPPGKDSLPKGYCTTFGGKYAAGACAKGYVGTCAKDEGNGVKTLTRYMPPVPAAMVPDLCSKVPGGVLLPN